MNDLLEHERQGSEAPSKGKKVDLHHEKGQAEKGGTDEVEKESPSARIARRLTTGTAEKCFFGAFAGCVSGFSLKSSIPGKGRPQDDVERAHSNPEGQGRGGGKQDMRIVLQGSFGRK